MPDPETIGLLMANQIGGQILEQQAQKRAQRSTDRKQALNNLTSSLRNTPNAGVPGERGHSPLGSAMTDPMTADLIRQIGADGGGMKILKALGLGGSPPLATPANPAKAATPSALPGHL